MNRFICQRCTYQWTSRGSVPHVCPSCHSLHWSEPPRAQLQCALCSHSWVSRTDKPKCCPRCKSRSWTGEKPTGSERGSIMYALWSNMIQRCTNPKHHGYKNYGGRGITVCQRWRNSFEAFLADVGVKPDDSLTLERINNDGNYEPGNVKWATRTEQNNNKRRRDKTSRHASIR